MSIAKENNHNFDNGSFKIFNDDGKEIYHEERSGFWIKKIYKDGKLFFYEDSSGYWVRRTINHDGKLICHSKGNDIVFDDAYLNKLTIDQI